MSTNKIRRVPPKTKAWNQLKKLSKRKRIPIDTSNFLSLTVQDIEEEIRKLKFTPQAPEEFPINRPKITRSKTDIYYEALRIQEGVSKKIIDKSRYRYYSTKDLQNILIKLKQERLLTQRAFNERNVKQKQYKNLGTQISIPLSPPLNFSETEELQKSIKKQLVRFRPRDSIQIQLIYTYSSNSVSNIGSKSFEAIQNRDIRDDFPRMFSSWRDNIHLEGSDAEAELNEVILKIIPENRGGCRKTEKIIRLPTMQVQDPVSRNNNCFFQCVKEQLGWKYVTDEKCNKIRQEFDLEPNSMISISSAIEIFEKHCPDYSISIHDNETNEFTTTSPGRTPDAQLFLSSNHYTRILTNHKKQCKKCGANYATQHNCKLAKFPFCSNCRDYHDPTKPCRKTRVEYVNRVLQSKKIDPEKDAKTMNSIIVHYDIETFVHHGSHIPYIVGFVVMRNRECLESFNFFAGDNCMHQFITYLSKFSSEKVVYVNAFNGANFDHIKFISTAMKMNKKPEKYIMTNGSIIRAKFDNLELIDVSKHTVGSLNANLKNFKCAVQKGDFDHSKASRWEIMSEELKADCLKYLQGDVDGLAELFIKINDEVFTKFNICIHDKFSISQMTFQVWSSKLQPDHAVCLPSMQQEPIFRQAVYGARTYPSKRAFESSQRDRVIAGEIKYEDIEDYLVDLDVVSLYPTAMAFNEFPTGKAYELASHTQITEFNQLLEHNSLPHGAGWLPLGIYHISFKANPNVAHAPLPRRSNGLLRWTLEEGEGYYTSVDIENALQQGYQIEITPKGGFYWKTKAPIFKSYIEELYQYKQKAEKGTAAYQISKLFMNGLYGKMIQRPIPQKTEWVKTSQEFWKFYGKNKVLEMEFINDSLYLVGTPRDEEVQEKSITKPTHIGAFILAYSRRIMLEYFQRTNLYFNSSDQEKRLENDFFYTDTDSIIVHARNMIDTNPGELGKVDFDIKGKLISAKFIAPKLYCCEYITKENEIKYHFRGKGVQESKLTSDAFDRMHQGEAIEFQRDFQMKKLTVKLNSKQKERSDEHFSILHLTGSQTSRTLNKTAWAGREFVGNHSVCLK